MTPWGTRGASLRPATHLPAFPAGHTVPCVTNFAAASRVASAVALEAHISATPLAIFPNSLPPVSATVTAAASGDQATDPSEDIFPSAVAAACGT